MSLFHHGDDKEKQEKEKYDEAQRKMEEARRHQQQQQQQHAPTVTPPSTANPSPTGLQPGPLGGQQPMGGTGTPQAGGTSLGAGAGAGMSIGGHDGQTRVADEGFESYTVRKGDTLSGIAQHFYGKASHWHQIFEANRGSISDPDKIREGQVLRIPKDSGSGGSRLA